MEIKTLGKSNNFNTRFNWTKKLNYSKPNFNFKLFIKNINWLTIFLILVFIFAIYAFEMFVYTYIGIVFGELWHYISSYPTNGYNLSTFLDYGIKFWFTPLYAYYIIWPFCWFIVIPAIIYFSNGKKGFFQYNTLSFMMYIVACLIYMFFPTTCSPSDYKDYLSQNDLFYDQIIALMNNTYNIFGACPSFHNFWAILFIIFGLQKKVNNWWRYPMIFLGLLITISTIFLHQHTIADVLITYGLCILFYLIDIHYSISNKLENIWDKIIKT